MACYDVNSLTASGSGELSVNLKTDGGLVSSASGIYTKPPAAFHVTRTANQTSLVTGVATKIQFNVEVFDAGNDFDAVTNFVFTAPVTGIYHFDASIQMDAAGTQCWCQIVQNSTVIALTNVYPATINDDTSSKASITTLLTAADTVEVRALHNAGSDRSCLGLNVGSLYFSGYYVGSAT